MFLRFLQKMLLSGVFVILMACKKDRDSPLTRSSYNLPPRLFTFQVVEVKQYCTDIRNRPVVILKCLQYPEGWEYHFKQRSPDSIFHSTTVPLDDIYGQCFESDLLEYVDWNETPRCTNKGVQVSFLFH